MTKENKKEVEIIIIKILILIIVSIFSFKLVLAGPTGPSNLTAYAGNITEVNVFLEGNDSTSDSWVGFYGNVSGGFKLADGSGNIFYNWSTVTPTGEVYTSINSSVIWTNIQCFNFTATGNYSDDSANRGNTSQFGMNLSQLESLYNISESDVDGVNETFNLRDHSLFYTNQLQFDAGECQNTRLLNSSGSGVFQEILLYSPDNRNVIFASIINYNAIGYDGATHDYEMLTLENGHNGDTSGTTYYFYLELGG